MARISMHLSGAPLLEEAQERPRKVHSDKLPKRFLTFRPHIEKLLLLPLKIGVGENDG